VLFGAIWFIRKVRHNKPAENENEKPPGGPWTGDGGTDTEGRIWGGTATYEVRMQRERKVETRKGANNTLDKNRCRNSQNHATKRSECSISHARRGNLTTIQRPLWNFAVLGTSGSGDKERGRRWKSKNPKPMVRTRRRKG
jgi:hypothetical protein